MLLGCLNSDFFFFKKKQSSNFLARRPVREPAHHCVGAEVLGSELERSAVFSHEHKTKDGHEHPDTFSVIVNPFGWKGNLSTV